MKSKMIIGKMFIIYSIFISFINCQDELIAINCREKILKQHLSKDIWTNKNIPITCPLSKLDILNLCYSVYSNAYFHDTIKIELNSDFCSNDICKPLNQDYKIYKCIVNKNSFSLDVPSGCLFKHTPTNYNKCDTELQWKNRANNLCLNDQELIQLNVIFQCPSTDGNNLKKYKAVQFVCCPKLDVYELYRKLSFDNETTLKKEQKQFYLAKKALLGKFKSNQKEIQDRFIKEEQSITIWSKYPGVASELEKKIQDKFQEKFMSEMYREGDLLRELEVMHENRMQKMFEINRKSALDRLKYTLQEANPEANRIMKALKLELESIISEVNDIVDFYETLIKEDIDKTKVNQRLINDNFKSLIFESWDNVIRLLDQVPTMKKEILKEIQIYKLEKQNIINRFKYLHNTYISRNSLENQTKIHMKNTILLYGHANDKAVKQSANFDDDKPEVTTVSQIIIICMLSSAMVLLMGLSMLLLYRFHPKINSYLSNTFKKIRPPTKNLLVQIENYPFKSRYNYGNGVYQPYFKSEESIIGNPNSVFNQNFSPTNEMNGNSVKQYVESDYNESSISNINGLENPICRLLDEK